MSLSALICMFLLPIFPFSLLTNRFLIRLRPKLFSIAIVSFFILGNITLIYANTNSYIIESVALFTTLFYSFRLLGTVDLKNFILYLYTVVSSLSWLWYLNGGEILESIVVKSPSIIILLSLYGFLSGQFNVVHQKSLKGLGGAMPRWSALFILSLLGVGSSLLFLGYEFLEIELSRLAIFYVIVLIISWIFVNWASIKTIEWLIYGEKRLDKHYRDLNNLQVSFLIVLVILNIVMFFFYNMESLA